MGLGTCWIGLQGLIVDGVNAEQVVRETLELPGNFGVLGMTPLGYAARYPGAHEPRIPEGRVHYEKYSGN